MARELRHGHHVKSADGAEYTVSYVHPASTGELKGMVDLTSIDGGRLTTLPLSELKRIPDPRNQRPPIEDVPDVRPSCALCNRPLQMYTNNTYANGNYSGRIIRRVFNRWKAYSGLFCTLSCAHSFAVAAHRAGYRIIRKG